MSKATLQVRLVNMVRARMEEQGVSQYELARRIGLTPSAICLILKGRRALTLAVLESMVAALDAELTVSVEGRS